MTSLNLLTFLQKAVRENAVVEGDFYFDQASKHIANNFGEDAIPNNLQAVATLALVYTMNGNTATTVFQGLPKSFGAAQ